MTDRYSIFEKERIRVEKRNQKLLESNLSTESTYAKVEKYCSAVYCLSDKFIKKNCHKPCYSIAEEVIHKKVMIATNPQSAKIATQQKWNYLPIVGKSLSLRIISFYPKHKTRESKEYCKKVPGYFYKVLVYNFKFI